MRRKHTIQLEYVNRASAERDVLDIAGMQFPCPLCKGPTLEVDDMERFRRCHRCAQMVRTNDCGKSEAEAWRDQKTMDARPPLVESNALDSKPTSKPNHGETTLFTIPGWRR